jgi:hypothetical protein
MSRTKYPLSPRALDRRARELLTYTKAAYDLYCAYQQWRGHGGFQPPITADELMDELSNYC